MMNSRFVFAFVSLTTACGSDHMVPPPVTTDATVTRDTPAVAEAAVDVVAIADVRTDVAIESAVDVATIDSSLPDVVATDVSDATDATIDVLTDTSQQVDSGAWNPIPGGSCNARERNVATQESPHVEPEAGVIVYLTNPPASGPHYPTWARWGAWPNLPRGYWVHNLEHGGVTYLFRCPTGTCDSTRDALLAATAMIPTDSACMPDDASPARVRVVITNDNEITSNVAAAAWGWLYAADCVDPPSIRSFYMRHAGMAPENFCADGFYP
jgi:hypothetical protein